MASSPSERAEEERAAAIVSRVLDAPAERTDGGGGAVQVADFAISTVAGPMPLEVTTAAVASELSTAKSRQKLSWVTEGPAHDWYLSHTSGLKVRTLHDQRRDLLLALEAAGIESIDTRYDNDMSHAAIRARLAALGIRRATVISVASPKGAEIYFGSSTVGTSAPSDVSVAVELEAWKDDNRAKLRPEGHLFVWIDSSLSDASAAMSFGVLPSGLDAPPELLAAWVAPGPYRDLDYLASPVWQWTVESGWTDLGRV